MSKKPYNILQIIPSMQSGGAEQSCIDVTAAITRSGNHAYVASAGGRWTAEIIRAGGKNILLPLKSKNPFTIWRNAARIAQIVQEYDIDIIHARSRAPAWSGYIAAKRMGIPFMTTFHAAYKFSSKLKQRYNSVMAKGTRIIAISQYIAQHIIDHYHVDPGRLRLVYRGMPLDRFNPDIIHPERLIKLAREWQLPEDKRLILMPSRLTRIKGHHVLIEALAKLGRNDWFCIICGATPDREHYQQELMALIDHHHLGDQIRIVPICTDVPAAMILAQVMVAPSLVPEGFGRMPVEAQAMGTPVVASAIGGHMEIIIDRETGWLVPPDDSEAMAAAINEALDMTEAERQLMARRAINFVHANFDKEQMTAQTLAVYEEILAERDAAHPQE